MKHTYTLTPTLARRLAITKQRLAGPRPNPDAEGIMELARDLGCLQLDPISAVARSHLLVLWSRLGAYEPAHLDMLLWRERALFEYWAHCASIVLTEDYGLHLIQMRAHATGSAAWEQRTRAWMRENEALRAEILRRLEAEGPLASQDFEDSARAEWHSGGWSSGRNVSRMLDHLWLQGTILVAGRTGQQRQWDLAERCLPPWAAREPLPERNAVRLAAQKALRALGVARKSHIQNHFIRSRYPGLPSVLAELQAEGLIVPVRVAGEGVEWPGPWFVHADDMPLLEALENGAWQPRTTLLSPFDNLICDRARTELLWDFFFRIEIYVPKEKRQYGYYVLPILHGDRLIGRIDPQMDRRSGRLTINALYAEPDAPQDAEASRAVAQAIEELACWLGAREIVYAGRVVEGWSAAIAHG
jgi:uncharacterized protein YcaQ